MRKTPTLTIERLKELLDYNPATGVFTCVKTRRGVAVGDVAGKLKDGYRRIGIDNQVYAASALAWFWVHGSWPVRNLWHKDENRDNAAIANLEYGSVDSKDIKAQNAYHRNWRKENPDKRRAMMRKAYYGVTPDQYEAMLLSQNGVCACCGKPETRFHNGAPMPLCVDHDHKTDEVRGLCCRSCNSALGLFKDSIETMEKAIGYLQAHASKPKTNVIPLAGRRIAGVKGE